MKRIFLLIAVAMLLAGCADQITFSEAETLGQVGFWHGLWHGFILPFAWAISLFDKDVAIYAIYNNGGWYDFGYLLGIASMFGSGADSTRRARAARASTF